MIDKCVEQGKREKRFFFANRQSQPQHSSGLCAAYQIANTGDC